jgi:hypothetical protein
MNNDKKVPRKVTLARKVIFATGAVVMTAGLMSAYDLRGGGVGTNAITCYNTWDTGTTTQFTKCNGCTMTTGNNPRDQSTCDC